MVFEPVAERKSFETASLSIPLRCLAGHAFKVILVNKHFTFLINLNMLLHSIYRQKHNQLILVEQQSAFKSLC